MQKVQGALDIFGTNDLLPWFEWGQKDIYIPINTNP